VISTQTSTPIEIVRTLEEAIMKGSFTNSELRLLRQLRGQVWEAELSVHLGELLEQFRTWEGRGVSAFELSDKIHEFHDGVARTLYSIYTGPDVQLGVARGLARGFLDKDCLGEVLAAKLESLVELCRHGMD